MGYMADSQGIINRYIRVGAAWDEHLANSKKFIINSLSTRRVNCLAVYGSGWLLDFPLDEIAHVAGKIRLYDVVHPPQVLHRAQKYSNIEVITADLTGGGLTEAYQAVRLYKRTGNIPDASGIFTGHFRPAAHADFIISLNILSQIGDIVTGYLCKHVPFNEDEINRMIEGLQKSHLKLLENGKSCLITDVVEKCFDMQGKLMTTKQLVRCSLPLGRNEQTWEWQFDPLGEYNPGLKTVSSVIAMEI
jgi:hypothetical protein